MSKTLKIKSISTVIFLFLPNILNAESLACKGVLPPSNTTTFQIDIDLSRPRLKSTIQYFLPDGSTYTQALGINKRKYKAGKIFYVDNFDPSTSLEAQVKDSRIIEATYSNVKADYEKIPLNCDIFGDIPAQDPCPKDKNLNLIESIRQANNVENVERAIECGANVNFANGQGCTPLMFLFDASCGASNTPVHGAGGGAFSKTKDIVDLLINSGAYVNVTDKNGETPLIKAVKNNVQDVYDSFIVSEVDMDAKDSLGNTALMYAALGGNPSIVADLLLGAPDRRVKNTDGLTAYDLAVHWERNEVIELLKIPDLTISIAGKSDGTCTPLKVKIEAGKIIELILTASDKMFRLSSKNLNLDLMAEPKHSTHQIFLASKKGEFNFTCGFHGSSNPSIGVFQIQKIFRIESKSSLPSETQSHKDFKL